MVDGLRGFLEPLVLPAGLIGILLMSTAVYVWWQPRTRVLKSVLVSVCATYFLLASAPVAMVLAWSLEYPFAGSVETGGAVAVVILAGAASIPTSPDQDAELNRAAFRRLWRGAELYRAMGGRLPVIYTGRPSETPPGVRDEAELAQDLGLRGGIKPEHFWIEGESLNTFESAVNTQALLARRGVSGPVALVTSAWHMRRSVAAFSKQGFVVLPVPCDHMGGRQWSLFGFVPTYEALSSSSITIREWIAIAGYRILGRI